jgi:hypothetical protein
VSGVSRSRGGFVKCVAIQKRLGIPALKCTRLFKTKYTLSKMYFTSTIEYMVTCYIHGVKKRLQVLRGYNTHLNEQKSPSQHLSRSQCVLRYWRVLHLTGYLDNTAVCFKRRSVRVMFVYLSLACVVTVSVDSVDALLQYL